MQTVSMRQTPAPNFKQTFLIKKILPLYFHIMHFFYSCDCHSKHFPGTLTLNLHTQLNKLFIAAWHYASFMFTSLHRPHEINM